MNPVAIRATCEQLERRLMLSGDLPFPAPITSMPEQPEAIWIEGEDRDWSNYIQWGAGNWYNNQGLRMDLLSPGEPYASDGQWESHYTNNASSAEAGWRFDVTAPGLYDWWVRLNPHSDDYSYRIDGGAWSDVQTGEVSTRLNLVEGGIDLRFLGWTYVGHLELTSGSHEIAIRISDADGQTHGAIDVMALVNYPWAPSGTLQPDTAAPTPAADQWFPLAIGPDAFSDASVIDMSYLLEDTAGSHGPLHRDADALRFADGTPVKFWAVGAAPADTLAGMHRQARFYAKHGINMIRLHPVQGLLGTLQYDSETGEAYLDAEKLDHLDRWFSILKENGIYSTWSLLFPHVITPADGYDADLYAELPDKGSGKSTYGFATFMPELQQLQWRWARTLLTHVNAYTGMAYKDDPALAVVEYHNEDSVFWHNPLSHSFVHGGESPLHLADLQKRFQLWLKDRYGTDAALAEAWGSGMLPADSVSNETMELYAAWEMEATGPAYAPAEKARMGDFIRFLARMQRDAYALREQNLRDLGYEGVTVSTAWKAGGDAAAAANLWTDDAMDMIDRHAYFGGSSHGWLVEPGPVNKDTHLTDPGSGLLANGMYQIDNRPFSMTEWNQNPPNQWRAEASPLIAAYGMGLQGWDASYQFSADRSYMANGWPDLSKFVSETPLYMAQFPALAFAVHNGHFEQGPIAAARRLDSDDLFKGVDPWTQPVGEGFADSTTLTTPEEVLAIGRVTSDFDDGITDSEKLNWEDYWDTSAQTIQAATGQLRWDYGTGVVQLRSDKTQGVVGFAGGRSFDLPGLTVDVQTDFVSLLFTALDDRPVIDSEHILITALARDQQYLSEFSADGAELLKTGSPPLMLEPVQAQITFKGEGISLARALDVYGVPTDRAVARSGNTIDIDGTCATYYYEVRRPLPPAVEDVIRDDGAQRLDRLEALSVVFNEDVTVEPSAMELIDLATYEAVDISGATFAYNPGSHRATWDLASPLEPGHYRIFFTAGGAYDADGLSLAENYIREMDVLHPGDADGDGTVGAADVDILRSHFLDSAVGWSGGDFNADGQADLADYVLLARNYGRSLPEPMPLAPAPLVDSADAPTVESTSRVQRATAVEPADSSLTLQAADALNFEPAGLDMFATASNDRAHEARGFALATSLEIAGPLLAPEPAEALPESHQSLGPGPIPEALPARRPLPPAAQAHDRAASDRPGEFPNPLPDILAMLNPLA